jgi:sodium-dependent dicarboxylate transporter 2/3/5
MYLLLLLTICVIWRPEASKYQNYDLDAARAKKIPLTTEGIIASAIFVLLVLTWIVPEVFPSLLPEVVTTKLSAWGNTVPAIVAVSLLCIIRVNDKPIAKFSEIAQAAPMTLLIFIGAVVVLGSAVSSSDTGISLALSNLFTPVISKLSVAVIVGIGVLMCLVLTNFVSNVVSMLLFFGLIIPAISGSSASVVAVSVIICLVANFASLVPSAAVTAPLFFGPGHITVQNTLKWNLIMIAFAFLVCVFILYPLGNAVL